MGLGFKSGQEGLLKPSPCLELPLHPHLADGMSLQGPPAESSMETPSLHLEQGGVGSP